MGVVARADNFAMDFSPTDTAFMQQALAEAEASMHTVFTSPLPGTFGVRKLTTIIFTPVVQTA